MTFDQAMALLETFLGSAALGTLFHLFGWAAKPWARVVLSVLPDVIGLIRRAKGLAGAPGAPKPVPATPPATLLLPLLFFFLTGCSGGKTLPPQDVAACLAQLNGELAGEVTCDAIVRSIAVVLAREPRCTELLLHGLQCEHGKDGGVDVLR